MDKTSSEIFGHFIYDESLTYDQLLSVEDAFIEAVDAILERADAENIDFTPMGDSLMLQCNCIGHKLYIFRKIACDLAEMLPQTISGRLVCLSHSLTICHIYWLHPKKWEEQSFLIPKVPPEGLKAWHAAQ
ncbi:MAG: hypothetical protein IJS54_04060 [Desulfovibrio sp.]|nr:hypothetical protein [Desulfovibrio sp.]